MGAVRPLYVQLSPLRTKAKQIRLNERGTEYGDNLARPAIRHATASESTGLRRRRHPHPRSRHWRINFDLLGCRRGAAASSPLSASPANRSRVGTDSQRPPNKLGTIKFR